MDQSTRLHKVFVLKDTKSASYGPPFTMETKGLAIRMIEDGVSSGQPVWAKHPQDFSLFEIGEYNPDTAEVKMYETKNCIGLVQDFKNSLG